MYPDGKVSPIQEAQMTTVLDANVHNIAVKGTFDDCQVRDSLPDEDHGSTDLDRTFLNRSSLTPSSTPLIA